MTPQNKPKAKRILAVDDVSAFTKLVKINLESTGGYEDCIVNDRTDAVKTAQEFHPDLILLDLAMPAVDGDQIASALRSNPVTKDTPIIFLSALGPRADRHVTRKNDETIRFLPKPVTRDELLHAVESAMEKSA